MASIVTSLTGLLPVWVELTAVIHSFDQETSTSHAGACNGVGSVLGGRVCFKHQWGVGL